MKGNSWIQPAHDRMTPFPSVDMAKRRRKGLPHHLGKGKDHPFNEFSTTA
jgi:hypothetical protein